MKKIIKPAGAALALGRNVKYNQMERSRQKQGTVLGDGASAVVKGLEETAAEGWR
jgi:hypothetical protein